jgi:hypothetical protein
MIPASYLFKDTYRQHWEEPEAPAVVHRRSHFLEGLATPLAAAVSAILVRRPATRGHRFGGHAYE